MNDGRPPQRSLWQVLGGYAVAAWVAYQVALALRDGLGLADRLPLYALLVLLAGVPAVIATWLVQRRIHASNAQGTPLLTPKRTILTIAAALTALATVTVAANVVRRGDTLLAHGLISADQPNVLADFTSSARDTLLGTVVTEALRIDLMQSDVIKLAQPSRIKAALERMQIDPRSGLSAQVAVDLAEREGMKAVIHGGVKQVGAGYLITAVVVVKDSIIDALMESAHDSTDFIPAVSRLSRKLRSKAGESLKRIRAGQPLERATTSSLPALRKYTEGSRAIYQRGDALGAAALYEEAIALDSSFAIAWTGLGIQLDNANVRPDDVLRATTRAWQLRDRLSERERHLVIAQYEPNVRGNLQGGIDAFQHLLRVDSTDFAVSNMLGVLLIEARRPDEAIASFRRSVTAGSVNARGNLAHTLMAVGRPEEAWSVYRSAASLFPDHFAIARRGVQMYAAEGSLASADSLARLVETRSTTVRSSRITLALDRIAIAHMQGKLAEGARLSERYRRNLASLGFRGEELTALLREAEVSIRLRGDTARGLQEIDAALRAIPLASLSPSGRPYLQLALLLHSVGEHSRADAMLAEVERLNSPGPKEYTYETIEFARAVGVLERGHAAEAVPLLVRATDALMCLTCKLDYVARAYDGAGMLDSARVTYERFLTNFEPQQVPHAGIRRATALLRLAELRESSADRSGAQRAYALFVASWAGADAELQPRVSAARRRLDHKP